MTRKQLEQAISFMAAYRSTMPEEEIKERFGVDVTDDTTAEQALSAFVQAKGIKLETTSLTNKSK